MRTKKMSASVPLVVAAVVALAAALTVGQRRLSAQATPAEAEAIKKLTWRSIGPTNNAGRTSVVVGIPGDPSTLYVAGAAGGIFKTTNAGMSFKPIFDDQPNISIGAIAIAPSDHNIIYVGTGEGNPRNSASFGEGMFKSIDAGEHWTQIGLADTDKIPRVVIDPKDPNVVYVAALGHEWGPNEERGLFKTTDGGKTWKKILYKNNLTGCSDVAIDPTNSNIVYAGMYTFRRWAWYFTSGAGETALYKSFDGGATWKKLTNGLPTEPMDRIGVAVSNSNPSVIYVVSETKTQGQLWRSDDAGESWRVVNRERNINFRPFYYSDVRVDPNESNTIYSLSGSLNKSEDGGRTFVTLPSTHGDHQALWIDPKDSRRILSGDDGGFSVSYDGGKTMESINTVPFTQFYHVHYDLQRPYYVCGGLQDNGTWCGPSIGLNGSIRKSDWLSIGGGDGFFAVPDLKEPWLVYEDSQGGSIGLTDLRTGTSRNINPYPNKVGSVGDAMENHKYRFNWNSPIELSPQDPETVYFGGNVLFKTTNHGQKWEVISPDLTTNDKSKQKSSGGPIVVDNTAAEFHCTIIAIAPSPLDPNVIWVGTDDGNVQLTRDGGKTWTNVVKNIPGLAPNAWIPSLEASPSAVGTAYVPADHHQDDDYTPYFFKTTDFGQTWKRITSGLPARGWAHVIREDPKNPNLLYAGTEVGVFASWDGGNRWVSIRNGLPPAPVRDIKIHPRDNDVIIATHGRGMYILDDAGPLQKLGEALTTDAYVFDLRPATRWVTQGRGGYGGNKPWSASNPPAGAYINYYLKADAKEPVVITILDKSGKPVREIRNAPPSAGVNRAIWDLRLESAIRGGAGRGAGAPGSGGGRGAAAGAAGPPGGVPAEVPPEVLARFGGGAGAGPDALPGEYTIKVKAAGKEFTKAVKVDLDPRLNVSTADLQAKLDVYYYMANLRNRTETVIERVNDLIDQLTALDEQLAKIAPRRTSTSSDGNGQSDTASLRADVKKTIEKLQAFRDDELARPAPVMGYRQYPRLREDLGTISTSGYAPVTEGEKIRMKELTEDVGTAEAKLNAIITGEIARINEAMSKTPRITVEPVK